jgi:hypothetical protein
MSLEEGYECGRWCVNGSSKIGHRSYTCVIQAYTIIVQKASEIRFIKGDGTIGGV